MNCREAEHQIFAERDGALDETQRAALAQHLGDCTSCRAARERFATAIDALRETSRAVRVPDADLEWQKVRREIRGGAGSRAAAKAATRSRVGWFALPLAAAAALAVTLYINPTGDKSVGNAPNVEVARSAEKPSTVVFVDDKSGYVFVWADETKTL